jgi:hypothetical protein
MGQQWLDAAPDSMNRKMDRWLALKRVGIAGFCLAVLCAGAEAARGGVAYGLVGSTLSGGHRWDAAPRTFNLSGTDYERSLDGGLRYSLEGGSFQAFRDMFSWSGSTPSVAAFQQAVEQAFAAWTVPDPVSQLTTQVSFIADLNTPVVGTSTPSSADSRGAEIDLFAAIDATFWNPGSTGTQAETWFNAPAGSGPVTLTSGTVGYTANAITGADIIINNNPGALYTLDLFRRLLAHEIGHTLGLGDVEGDISPGRFIDDNYDSSSSATALATLTNSWTSLVNTANPALSPLARFTVPEADPGTDTVGVNILMESRGLGIAAGNPVTNLTPMTNDDYGTRQFLYPSTILVPEPSTLLLAAIAAVLVAARRHRRARRG